MKTRENSYSNKHMKILMNNWKLLLFLTTVFVVGPLVINVAFKVQAPYEWLRAEWDAGDALSLFAAISAALLAIIYGISLTIRSSNKEFKENLRNQVRPFIVADFLKSRPRKANRISGNATELKEEVADDYYEEYSQKTIYYIFSEKSKSKDYIEARRRLKPEQRAIIENGGILNISPSKRLAQNRKRTHCYDRQCVSFMCHIRPQLMQKRKATL